MIDYGSQTKNYGTFNFKFVFKICKNNYVLQLVYVMVTTIFL